MIVELLPWFFWLPNKSVNDTFNSLHKAQAGEKKRFEKRDSVICERHVKNIWSTCGRVRKYYPNKLNIGIISYR